MMSFASASRRESWSCPQVVHPWGGVEKIFKFLFSFIFFWFDFVESGGSILAYKVNTLFKLRCFITNKTITTVTTNIVTT